jgi:hypothetical protein
MTELVGQAGLPGLAAASGLPAPSPLTAALLRPLRADHCLVSSAEIERLSAELGALVAHRPGGPFRLTDYLVRTTLWPSGSPDPSSQFAWSAGTARRGIGLAAVRSMVAGTTQSPVDGVDLGVSRAISDERRGRGPMSSMGQWLAGLTAAERAAVQADAVTWATRLWNSLDWKAFDSPPTIGRDHWWDSPHSSLLAIRSRAEVRSSSTDGRGNPVSVHLVVLGGPRRAGVRSELSLVALVESLRTGDPRPPGRIVGWWPDSGHFVSLEVDQVTLSLGVTTVARTVALLGVPDRRSGAAAWEPADLAYRCHPHANSR